jgi:putative MATE family efflux protein
MRNDFSKGRVWKNILTQMVPLLLAQMVLLLYNVVDRIYIGHLPGSDSLALTGVGLTFPIVTLIMAFCALFGMGGAPLFSIARGAGREEEAEEILGNVATMLLVSSVLLCGFGLLFRRPVLYFFGASDSSYFYADQYLRIYLLGTTFSMLSTGLNFFINAQGYPVKGMLTTVIGAVLNLILDPVLIFVCRMGVSGAALATVGSHAVSALWVLRFLTDAKTPLRIRRGNLRLRRGIVRRVLSLGLAGFIMQGTNCLVQVVCNTTLQRYGGDLYVGIMTVLNSVRELLSLPVSALSSGAQPVLGFDYGAKRFHRVKEGIRFTSLIGIAYTLGAWLVVFAFPHFWVSVFSNDETLIADGARALRLYFFGFFFMSFQFSGQSVFQGLGKAKQAIFFSLLRKAVIVTPLTLLLPRLGFGVDGVFLAEPISNAVGGLASFLTMYFTVYRKIE